MNKSISLIMVGALLIAGQAFGQAQSKKQQKCINALNKGMAKVAAAQTRANAKCVTSFAKGKNADAATCLQMAPKVDTAAARTCTAETKSCATTPDFGYTSCLSVNLSSEQNGIGLAWDLFGFAINSGITTCSADKPGCKCQAQILKGVNKLYAVHLKEFNKCKKGGLKSKTAPIMNTSQLDSCVFADPKMKISKAQMKLANAITKKCANVTTPLSEGSCVGLTGANLSFCLEKRVRCRACLTARESDALGIPCDDFDDDINNGSCDEL